LPELASEMVHSINAAQRYCRNEQAGFNQAGHLPELDQTAPISAELTYSICKLPNPAIASCLSFPHLS